MAMVQEVTGVRDTKIFHVGDGFYFRINSSDGKRAYLVCKYQGCSSRASMPLRVGDRTVESFKSTVVHNHGPDVQFVNVCKLRSDILRRCRDEPNEYKHIFDEECARVPLEVSGQISFRSLKRSMLRAKDAHMQAIPQTLAEYGEMLGHSTFRRTLSDGQFYMTTLNDAVGGTSVVFGSPTFIRLLPQARELHLDGTFKVRPNIPPSRQILTVMSMHYEHAYPVFFIVMENKSVQAYRTVLHYIKTCTPELSPQILITDFERSLQIAVQEAFPRSQVVGCWFHSANAMRKKARNLGLTTLMNENQHVKKIVKMAMALPLLPQHLVHQGLQDIEIYAAQNNVLIEMAAFLQYVRRTWVEGVGAQFLSVYGQRRRTNNDQESFHNQLIQKMRRAHPTVWTFTDGLKKIEHSYVQAYASILSGAAPLRQSRTSAYLANDNRIVAASDQLASGAILVSEFLHLVCHSIDNVYDPQNVFVEREEGEEEDDEIHAPPPLPPNVQPLPEPALVRPLQGRRARRGRGGRPIPDILPLQGERRGHGRPRGRGRGQYGAYRPVVPAMLANENYEEQVTRLALLDIEANEVLPGPGEPVCVACMGHKRQYMVNPCNHVVLCGPCALIHRQGVRDEFNALLNFVVCPQCRSKVETYVKVYI